MTKQDEEMLQSLITGGLIGAFIGGLISEKKGEGAILGAIAGSAALATYKAHLQAKELDIPIVIVEDNKLYEVYPDGTKKFMKDL